MPVKLDSTKAPIVMDVAHSLSLLLSAIYFFLLHLRRTVGSIGDGIVICTLCLCRGHEEKGYTVFPPEGSGEVVQGRPQCSPICSSSGKKTALKDQPVIFRGAWHFAPFDKSRDVDISRLRDRLQPVAG